MLVFLRVHILADVTSLSVTPSSAGLNVLDEHCMPDQESDTACKHTPSYRDLQ